MAIDRKTLFSLPVLLPAVLGGWIVWRMRQAKDVESGGGDSAEDIPEEIAPTGPCAALHDQFNLPAGCGTVAAEVYKKGVQSTATLRELEQHPGFYLQVAPINAWAAFHRLERAANRVGIRIQVNSSYRSMAKQQKLYRDYVLGIGNLAAKPGYSNHQEGTAVDLQVKTNPALYDFLVRNGQRYGFLDDAQKGKPAYEPWHWHYKPELDTIGGDNIA